MLNPRSPIPLYRQLADLLLAGIRSGEYPAGSRVPAEQALAAAYGIGRPTVRQALELLVRKRVLVRRRGSGTYVAEKRREVDLFSLAGTLSAFQRKGIEPSVEILHPARLQPIPDGLENPFSGSRAYFLSRLTRVDKTPVLLEEITLHPQLFAGIDGIDLKNRSLSRVVQERFYLRPSGGRQNFRIATLDGEKARLMGVASTEPILAVQRFLNFDSVENGIYADLFCRTDQFVFSQTIGGMTDD